MQIRLLIRSLSTYDNCTLCNMSIDACVPGCETLQKSTKTWNLSHKFTSKKYLLCRSIMKMFRNVFPLYIQRIFLEKKNLMILLLLKIFIDLFLFPFSILALNSIFRDTLGKGRNVDSIVLNTSRFNFTRKSFFYCLSFMISVTFLSLFEKNKK